MGRLRFLFLLLLFALPQNITLHANGPPDVMAGAAVLMDVGSGKVLFEHNAHETLFPAGITRVMTALVALDHLCPDDVIVVGAEIFNVPAGVFRAGHQQGEHITVRNVLRGLLLRSGNDSGAVLALHTVQAERGRTGIPYASAERIFSGMMNDRARALGATRTNFVNPNGLHNESHVTTAHDMALIARAFMEHPVLAGIVADREFIGNSLDGVADPPTGVRTQDYVWLNNNELLSGGPFTYVYAVGITTGSTPQAGDNVVAAAQKNGVNLVAVVLNAPDPARWEAAVALFDYGFAQYRYHTLLAAGESVALLPIENAIRGHPRTMNVVSGYAFAVLLNDGEATRLERHLRINEYFMPSGEAPPSLEAAALRAPMKPGQPIGTIAYILDGQIVFEGPALASAMAKPRTWDADMDYFLHWVQVRFFSVRSLPYWLGVAGVLFGLAGISYAVNERRRRKRAWYK